MISPVKYWRRQKMIRKLLGKKGKILTWTKIYVAGHDFARMTPYSVVLVEFDDGGRVFGQLVDYHQNDLKINKKVVSILRKTRDTNNEDIIVYGIKFKPFY